MEFTVFKRNGRKADTDRCRSVDRRMGNIALINYHFTSVAYSGKTKYNLGFVSIARLCTFRRKRQATSLNLESDNNLNVLENTQLECLQNFKRQVGESASRYATMSLSKMALILAPVCFY